MRFSLTHEQKNLLSSIADETGLTEVQKYYRSKDLVVFEQTAVKHSCYILVRRTNQESIKYIGKPGFVSKPVDCKPKTAARDISLMSDRSKKSHCGGLVVKPQMVGKEAFNGDYHLSSCVNLWKRHFNPLPKRFAIEEDKDSGFYGCVKLSSSPDEKGQYIHGDYDLYSLIDAHAPSVRSSIEGIVDGHKHTHGKLWELVSRALNDGFGECLIRHGSQEHFCYHSDEDIDMFTPINERRYARLTIKGARNLERLYSEFFKGRMTKDRELILL